MSELCAEEFLEIAARVSKRALHVKHVNPDKTGLGTPSCVWEGIAVHSAEQTPYDSGEKIRIGLMSGGNDLRCVWIGSAVKTKTGATLKADIENPNEAIEFIRMQMAAQLG